MVEDQAICDNTRKRVLHEYYEGKVREYSSTWERELNDLATALNKKRTCAPAMIRQPKTCGSSKAFHEIMISSARRSNGIVLEDVVNMQQKLKKIL